MSSGAVCLTKERLVKLHVFAAHTPTPGPKMRHTEQSAGLELLWLLAVSLSVELIVVFAGLMLH